MLNEYLTRVQLLLNQTNTQSQLFATTNLTNYINQARKRIAAKGQCVRVLLPPNGGVQTVVVVNGGSGYASAPDVIISAPDAPSSMPGIPATATAVLSGGAVGSVLITLSGSGYFAPVVSFSGATSGTQASAFAVTTALCATTGGREIYTFAQFSGLVRSQMPGVESILAVKGVSWLWGNIRYSKVSVGFTKYQAKYRNIANSYLGPPQVVTQFGQGENGSLYMFPVPDSAYPMEWDCICLPEDIDDDSDPEPIPYPWTDAVPYYAAYLALLGVQRIEPAANMLKEFDRLMMEARSMSQPGGPVNPYGRAP